LYTWGKKVCENDGEKIKINKVKSPLADTKLNFFPDSTLAGTILIDLTHADTIHLQIPY